MTMPRNRPVGAGHNTYIEHTRLEDWRHQHGYSMAVLARELGVNYYTVKRWCRGSHLPTIARAFAIDRLTRGAVPLESWLDTKLGQAEMANVPFFAKEAEREASARKAARMGRAAR